MRRIRLVARSLVCAGLLGLTGACQFFQNEFFVFHAGDPSTAWNDDLAEPADPTAAR